MHPNMKSFRWGRVLLPLLILLVLAHCSKKSRLEIGAPELDPVIQPSCTAFLQAQVRVLNLDSLTISANTNVTWEIEATACIDKTLEVIVDDGIPLSFNNNKVTINASYKMAGTYSENFLVIARDTLGNVEKVELKTPELIVTPTCIVVPGSDSVEVRVDTEGQIITPATLSFTVIQTSEGEGMVSAVSTEAGLVEPSLEDTQLPTASGLSHTIKVSPPLLGDQEFTFMMADSLEPQILGSCATQISIIAIPEPAPAILEFSSSPSAIDFGLPALLTLRTEGLVTSASVNGMDVSTAIITAGFAQGFVTPMETGLHFFDAIVSGPGGTTLQSLNLLVNPTCVLTKDPNIESIQGLATPLELSVNGQFVIATISGGGAISDTVPTFAGTRTIPITPLLSGTQTFIANVVGLGISGTQCETTFEVIPPSVDLKVNIDDGGGFQDGPVSISRGNSIELTWQSTGVSQCQLEQEVGGVVSTVVLGNVLELPTDTITTTPPLGTVTYRIICDPLSGGPTDSVIVNTTCSGTTLLGTNSADFYHKVRAVEGPVIQHVMNFHSPTALKICTLLTGGLHPNVVSMSNRNSDGSTGWRSPGDNGYMRWDPSSGTWVRCLGGVCGWPNQWLARLTCGC